jgi:hypothetical protein
VPDSIQRKVFEYVQENWASEVRGFPVRANDNLLETYSIDTEEVEAAMLELPELCGREKPLLSLWKGQPIGSVGDLARFVANLPTAEEVQEEGVRRLWTNQ